MSKLEGLLEQLKEHPFKCDIGNYVYTIYQEDVVECLVADINIHWDGASLLYTYTLHTEETSDGAYDVLYRHDKEIYMDEKSAKRHLYVPVWKKDISECEKRIKGLEDRIAWLQELDVKERIKELERSMEEEKQRIANNKKKLEELEGAEDAE